MFITISNKEVKAVIKRYYEEIEDGEVSVSFMVYDEDYMYSRGTIIYVKRKENINGINYEVESELKDDELKEIFNYYLGGKYLVENVTRQVDYVTTGYGLGENTDLNFTGLKLEVNIKNKVKKIGGQNNGKNLY